MTQFKKVELLESLKHLYKGNEIDGEHFKKLKEFIEQSFTPTTAPLTDDERKWLEDNQIYCTPCRMGNRYTVDIHKSNGMVLEYVATGIGRTKDEAERDAYNQLKEAKLIIEEYVKEFVK